MLNFQKLTIDKIPDLKPYFTLARNKACDNTVGAAFMWRDYFSTEYALCGNTLFCKARLEDGKVVFSFPLGGEEQAGLASLDAYCAETGITPAIWAATKAELPVLKEFFGRITVEPETIWNDYLYRADDFRTFSGKRFHGQRNHMNFFKRTYPDFSFEEINEENLIGVRNFFGQIETEKPSGIFAEEMRKTAEVLDNYVLYDMKGGLLRVGGTIVGFSVGEVYGNTLYVHIEKANAAYRGAYQMLQNQFVLRFGAGVELVNREEDAGDAGLRTAKLSYHPCEILEKFTVTKQSS